MVEIITNRAKSRTTNSLGSPSGKNEPCEFFTGTRAVKFYRGKRTAHRGNCAEIMCDLDYGIGKVLPGTHFEMTSMHASAPVGTCPLVFIVRQM